MDKVKEILDGIKDRFSNPLVFSFLCAWIVYNWEIVIALFWYDPIQFEMAGYSNVYDFIKSQINWYSGFCMPLIVATIYTVVMPVLKVGVQLLYTLIEKEGENRRLEILKGGKISVNKYLSLRKSYFQKIDELQETIDKESVHLGEINKLAEDNRGLKSQLEGAEIKLEIVERTILKITDGSALNGLWRITFDLDMDSKTTETISINYPDCYLQTHGANRFYGRVLRFLTSTDGNNVFFQLKLSQDLIDEYGIPTYGQKLIMKSSPVFSFDLYRNGKEEMRGHANDKISVRFNMI